MSSESDVVTREHFRYIAERTSKDDEFLLELKRNAVAKGIPEIQISPEQASLMQILLKLHGSRRVVELGCLAGYSAIKMARALPEDGRVLSIEINADYARFAEDWIARSDVAAKITVLVGDGRQVMRGLEDRSADALFLDADKKGYAFYLAEGHRILAPGALIMVDNAFAFGELFSAEPRDQAVKVVREFNEVMAADPGVEAVIVPIGDGLWVGRKRDSDGQV